MKLEVRGKVYKDGEETVNLVLGNPYLYSLDKEEIDFGPTISIPAAAPGISNTVIPPLQTDVQEVGQDG